MTHTEIINFYARRFLPCRYLEIGVRDGANFREVGAEIKHGVDPNVPCEFRMTSDEFFAQNRTIYDLVFIDGLHLYPQAYRDITNAIRWTHHDSVILVHDCNPPTKWHQRDVYDGGAWNGTVWKAFVRLRHELCTVRMFVVDADWGIGVIQRGKSDLVFREEMLDWNYFDAHRAELLDLRAGPE